MSRSSRDAVHRPGDRDLLVRFLADDPLLDQLPAAALKQLAGRCTLRSTGTAALRFPTALRYCFGWRTRP